MLVVISMARQLLGAVVALLLGGAVGVHAMWAGVNEIEMKRAILTFARGCPCGTMSQHQLGSISRTSTQLHRAGIPSRTQR